MSYRNPKQFVDTQTAQHYRNLQKTMTGITEDYINTIKQQQAAETKRLKEIAKILSNAAEVPKKPFLVVLDDDSTFFSAIYSQ